MRQRCSGSLSSGIIASSSGAQVALAVQTVAARLLLRMNSGDLGSLQAEAAHQATLVEEKRLGGFVHRGGGQRGGHALVRIGTAHDERQLRERRIS